MYSDQDHVPAQGYLLFLMRKDLSLWLPLFVVRLVADFFGMYRCIYTQRSSIQTLLSQSLSFSSLLPHPSTTAAMSFSSDFYDGSPLPNTLRAATTPVAPAVIRGIHIQSPMPIVLDLNEVNCTSWVRAFTAVFSQ